MKSVKKILSLMLVAAMLLSVMPVQWIAAEEAPQILVGSASVDVSGGAATCVIPVEIKSNPGFATFTIQADIPDGWSLVTTDNDGDEYENEDYYIQNMESDYSILCSTFTFNGSTMATGVKGNFIANLADGKFTCANAVNYTGDGKLLYLTYSVPSGAANGDHEISLNVQELAGVTENYTKSVTVTPGKVTVSGGVDLLTDANTTVGAVSPSYTYTGSAIRPVPVIVYNGTTLSEGTDYTVTYANNTVPGTATMTITGTGSYKGEITKTFVITKADGVITGTAAYTKQYGDASFRLDAAANSGAKLSYASSNDAVASVDANGNVTVVGAGSAVITVSAGATDCYTAPVDYKVNVTVGLAEQTLTGTASHEKTYGDAAFKLNTQGAKGTLSYVSSNPAVATVENGTVTVKGVGETEITVNAAEVAGKYGPASMTVTVTVARKEVTVSGITAEDKTYDGTTSVTVNTSAAVISGKVAGDDVKVEASGAFTDATAAENKTVSLNVSLTGAAAANYVLADDSQSETTATIEKDKVEVPKARTGLVFNTQVQTGVAETEDYTVSGGTATNAGRHEATVTLVDSVNYEWAGDFDGKLTWNIAQADGVALSKDVTRRYSSTQAIEITGDSVVEMMNMPGEVRLSNWSVRDTDGILTGANGAYALVSGLTDADAGKSAVITADVDSDNYKTSTLTVTVRVIDKNDVSAGITFEAGSADYTGEKHTHETATYNGSSAGIRYTYSATPIDAGTYYVTAIYEDEDNYGEATVTFTVNPVELTVVSGAKVTTKTYDGTTAAEVTDVVFDGLVNGEAMDASDYVVTAAAFADANVGTGKSVTYTVELTENEKTGNYVLVGTAPAASGEIAPKTVTVTVNEIADQTFSGSALRPTVTVTAEGTVDGYVLAENTDYTVSYRNNTNAGTAQVTVSARNGSNYTFAAAEGSFRINKLGQPDLTVPALTVKYSVEGAQTASISGIPANAGKISYTVGAMSGETGMVTAVVAADGKITVSLTQVEEEMVGATVTIPVTVEMENYESATVELVITRSEKDTPVAAAQDITKTYDGMALKDAAIQGTATCNGSVVSGTWSWVTDPDQMINAGSYEATVLFTPDDAANYSAVEASVKVVIKTAQVQAPEIGRNNDAEILDDVLTAKDFVDAQGNVIEGTLTWYDEDGNEIPGTTEIDKGTEYTWKFVPADSNNYGEPITGTYKSSDASLLIWAAILGGAAGGVNFDDVSSYDWYADAVEYVVKEGLFEGVSENEFRPNGNMTRAMLVTVLWRLEGSPKIYGYADFRDVAHDTWYTEAVAWASKYDIVQGISDTEFAPNASITREQMAAMLYRYAAYKGLDTDASASLKAYNDASSVSAYAEEAVEWAVTFGLIQGMNETTLAPQGTATRAQVATILMRFTQWFGL